MNPNPDPKWVDILWECKKVRFIPSDNNVNDLSGNVLFCVSCKDVDIEILFGPEDTDGFFHNESDGDLYPQLLELLEDIPGFCNINNFNFKVIWEEFQKELPEIKKGEVISLIKSRLERSGVIERKV